ncbi:MAG: hypothetical protein ACOX6T_09725 [Myxococcales bacterium]
MAALKAQEAEIAATWEITAFRLHDFRSGSYTGLYSSAVSGAANRVRNDLRDFDSFDPSNRSGRINAVSEYELTQVDCGVRRGGNAGSGMGPGGGLGSSFLHSDGWVGCQARVEFSNRFLPRNAHREFFRRSELLPSEASSFALCGLGRDPQGCRASRNRGMVLFTDDWGLENPSENPLGTQQNPQYWNVGNAIYSVLGTANLGALAVLGGFTPLVYAFDQANTSSFRMTYRKRITVEQDVSTAAGTFRAHASPHCDEDRPALEEYTHRIAKMSAKVYSERVPGNYLGKQQADWNLQ